MIDKLKAYWTSWGNGNANSVQSIIELTPELKELSNTPQSKSVHAEGTVAKHTILTCEAANDLASTLQPAFRKIFRYAALLHDIGKPECLKEAAPGIYSFDNHARISFTQARILLDRYTQLTIKEKEHILGLIDNHTFPIDFITKDLPLKQLYKVSVECNLEVLYYLALANYMGRQAQNLRQTLEKIELFKEVIKQHDLWGAKSWQGLLHISKYKRFGKNEITMKNIIDWYYITDQIENDLQAQFMLTDTHKYQWGTLFLPVGSVGSGKSSWIQKTYPMISLVSKEKIASQNELFVDDETTMDIAKTSLSDFLSIGKQVIYYDSNVNFDQRRQIIDLARNFGAHIVIIMFTTSYDNCLIRLQKLHSEKTALKILNDNYKNYDYVKQYEYDKIIYV